MIADPVVVSRRGPWRVERFFLEHDEATLRAAPQLYAPPGTYTRLVHDKRGMVMSNLPFELQDHRQFVRRAAGHVHINGLGLGLVLHEVLRRARVTHVSVVEVDRDVLRMIGKKFSGDRRVELIRADALEYEPPRGMFFRAVWHDIWDSFWLPELEQARELFRTWRARCAWQGAWGIRMLSKLWRPGMPQPKSVK